MKLRHDLCQTVGKPITLHNPFISMYLSNSLYRVVPQVTRHITAELQREIIYIVASSKWFHVFIASDGETMAVLHVA